MPQHPSSGIWQRSAQDKQWIRRRRIGWSQRTKPAASWEALPSGKGLETKGLCTGILIVPYNALPTELSPGDTRFATPNVARHGCLQKKRSGDTGATRRQLERMSPGDICCRVSPGCLQTKYDVACRRRYAIWCKERVPTEKATPLCRPMYFLKKNNFRNLLKI